MPAVIDLTTEAAVTDIFTDNNFLNELHLYLGLDPNVDAANQPVDVENLLKTVLHQIESSQWRVILEKTVTLSLPYNAICSIDNRIYLPYGSVASITTFAYTDQDEQAQTLASGWTLYSDEPAFIWAENWHNLLTLSTTSPYPITLTYTTGYDAFAKIPGSTLMAIKILCYYHYHNRGLDTVELPKAYEYHVCQAMLNHQRTQEYIS